MYDFSSIRLFKEKVEGINTAEMWEWDDNSYNLRMTTITIFGIKEMNKKEEHVNYDILSGSMLSDNVMG